MAKRKLKDLPKTKSRIKTVGQDSLSKGIRGISLRQSHPALALEYIDKGPYGVDDLTAGSNRVVEWLHERCGQKIRVAVGIRCRAWDEGSAHQGCYYCANRRPGQSPPKVIPNWLQDECVPDSRFKTRIQDISPWSQTYREYRCQSRSGTVFSSRIVDRVNPFTGNEKQGCPCEKCYLGERRNLKTESANCKGGKPDVRSMFITTRENTGFNPEKLPFHHRVRWQCDKDPSHRFSRSLAELYEDGCPTCAKENDDNSLAAPQYRHIVREFLFVLSNPTLAPVDIKPASNRVAAFYCSAGHTFKTAIYRRTQKTNPENCPFCAGKRSDAPRLFSVSPYLLKRWHKENNVVLDKKTGESKPIEPETILADSRKKLWFYCHAGHSYCTSAADLLAGSDTCPDCVLLPNCVDNVRPEITDQWHKRRNGERTPWNTAANSSTRVWWKCQSGPDHEWQTEVCQRAVKGSNCPYCANRKLSVTNSLQAVYPEMAKLMQPSDNGGKGAADLIASSSQAIWWRCSCSSVYKRVIQHMLARGPGCGDCRREAREGNMSD